ncbi:MAG: glycosyltransferase family 2 protein [Chloroflexi bacterium]|nr:glycosyltransferase family 2 protein [Chloroflexota bacterium]
MPDVTAVILTYNEAAHVGDCVASLLWADEVIVFDSFSTDETAALAEQAGARVMAHPFENFGAQRDAALNAIEAEWIFFVDADERATPALAGEVRERITQPERGWWVPRDNYIFGRLPRGAGWYPDYQLRLLHRTSARYDPARPVHETVILDGAEGWLDNALIHYNYATREQFRRKQDRYTDLEAQARCQAGLRPKPWTYLTGPLRQFWWRFVTLKGYQDGLHGLELSLRMARWEFEAWRRVNRLCGDR